MSDRTLRPLRPLAARPRPNRKPRPAEREPSLDELFGDPVLQALMARDGIDRSGLERVIANARQRLGIATSGAGAIGGVPRLPSPATASAFEAVLFAECWA